MIRMDVARAAGYDSRLRRAEDVDFLLRVMMKQPYGMLGKPLYAYSEHYSLNWQAIAASHFSMLRIHSKYLSRFPLKSLGKMGGRLGKGLVTIAIGIMGLKGLYSQLRPLQSPSSTQLEEFNDARQQVLSREADLVAEVI